jgi:tetratricopeptide (TPR) repeat protein
VRLSAFAALWVLLPLAAAAGQKPATQASQPVPNAVEQRADAYANFMLGHISQEQFEATGEQNYADQAIDYYKKALALHPGGVIIQLKMAQTYAESQHLREAVETAQNILKVHPDSVETHQLLARIYVRSLGELGANANQHQALEKAAEQYETILKLDPSDTDAGLWLARLYRFENQPDKAAAVLERLLKRDPTNQELLAQYAQLLLDEGHAEQAIARLKKVAGEESSGHLYDLLGDAYTKMHDATNAVQAYRQAVQLEPEDPAHWRRLARTLFDANQFAEAAKAYQKVANLDPGDPNSFLRLAEIYYQEKKYDLAETNIEHAAELAPGNLEVIYNQALIAEAQGHYEAAIKVISEAISDLKHQQSTEALSPRVYSILYDELGRLYRQQGDYPSAIRTFHEMMALGPSEEHRGRFELIETYRENNQIDMAIATAQQGLQASPHDRAMKIEYALLLGDKQETGKAVKTLKTLLTGTPADRSLYLDIAQVELRGRHYRAAEKAAQLSESLSSQPDDKAEAWFLLGAIYERQKKYHPAEQLFRKALAVNPNNAEVLNYYGYMLAEQGIRLDQAAELVRRALALDGGNSAYLDSLGYTYYRQNRLTDAREYLLKAVAHSPNDPTILGHLGDVYDRLGDTSLAIQTWEKALAAWRHAVPADYEPAKVKALERKLARARERSARKSHADPGGRH